MLREQVVEVLTRRKLDALSISLGIFDAKSLDEEVLHRRFSRTRVFGNDVMLSFMTLADLRRVADALGVDRKGANRDQLISSLLGVRRSRNSNQTGKAKAGNKAKTETKTKDKPKTKSKRDAVSSKKTQQVSDLVLTPVPKNDDKEGGGPSAEIADGGNDSKKKGVSGDVPPFDATGVAPGLMDCRHMWLHKGGKAWLLSARSGYTVAAFEKRESAISWKRDFDKFRSYAHIPVIEGLSPGCRGLEPDGPIYLPGWKPNWSGASSQPGSQGVSTTNGSSITDKDTPDTVYECPVCEGSVKLRHVREHLSHHSSREKRSSDVIEYVFGLEHVAETIMEAERERRSRERRKAAVARVRPKKKRRNTAAKRKPASKAKKKVKKKRLTATASGARSEDLWVRNRPWSGGGANGTGKRR